MIGMVKSCMQLKYDFNFPVNGSNDSEEYEIKFRLFIIRPTFRILRV